MPFLFLALQIRDNTAAPDALQTPDSPPPGRLAFS